MLKGAGQAGRCALWIFGTKASKQLRKITTFSGKEKNSSTGVEGEGGGGEEGTGVFPVACGNSQPQKPSIFVGHRGGDGIRWARGHGALRPVTEFSPRPHE